LRIVEPWCRAPTGGHRQYAALCRSPSELAMAVSQIRVPSTRRISQRKRAPWEVAILEAGAWLDLRVGVHACKPNIIDSMKANFFCFFTTTFLNRLHSSPCCTRARVSDCRTPLVPYLIRPPVHGEVHDRSVIVSSQLFSKIPKWYTLSAQMKYGKRSLRRLLSAHSPLPCKKPVLCRSTVIFTFWRKSTLKCATVRK